MSSPVKLTISGVKTGMLAIVLMMTAQLSAQVVYDNCEDITAVKYVTRPEGRVELFVPNPSPDQVNPSPRCAKFVRNRQKYDYVKVMPERKLQDVEAYASYDGAAPRLRMKVYTTAPPGSVVELQLGRQHVNAYPEGTHSQYQAKTTKSGEWEDLEFRFIDSPKGSETTGRQVDQVTVLFMPSSNATAEFYFDELRGPAFQDEPARKFFRKKEGIRK